MTEYQEIEELASILEESGKTYDLEERTFLFAVSVRKFVRMIPKDICNLQDIPQLVRSSGSVAANYIEANEALSKKDFYYRIRVCKKEAKESRLFLRLLKEGIRIESEPERISLIEEITEFIKIFQTILKHDPN